MTPSGLPLSLPAPVCTPLVFSWLLLCLTDLFLAETRLSFLRAEVRFAAVLGLLSAAALALSFPVFSSLAAAVLARAA